MDPKRIISIISSLPFDQQAEIVDEILQTLQQPDPVVEQAWMNEVDRRAREVDLWGSRNDSR